MWGENSSGKRISLLNNDSSLPSRPRSQPPPPSTAHTHLNKHYRPTLRNRSPHSNSSSSTSIASTASVQSCSSRSSISRSPGHSPPTPPLTRLDILPTIKTKSKPTSPMTPQYGFEPSDSTQNKPMNFPYYHPLAKPQGFGPMVDAPVPNPYYHLQGQQPLPPLDPLSLDDAYSLPNALRRLQTQQLSHYPADPSLHQFSPTSDSAHLTSPNGSLLHTPASTFQQHTQALPNHHSNVPTAAATAPLAAATTSPAKGSPTATSKPAAANSPSTNNATGPPKKKYPCPHAASYNCSDTFTTSGHAARHGKKHTGEKNVHCPTCGKAFTRKDNMKQHERTHKGANAHSTASSGTQSSHSRVPSGSASPASVTKTPVSASHSRRTSDVLRGPSSTPGASMTSPVTDAMDLDTNTSSAMGRKAMMAPMVPQMGSGGGSSKNERPRMPRSELSEILENVQNSGGADGLEDADAEGESPGLDALAIAAGQA